MLKQQELFTLITDQGLSINQYYILCCRKDGVYPCKVNYLFERRYLLAEAWLIPDEDDCILTQKSMDLIDAIEKLFLKAKPITSSKLMGDDFKENILKYRELFPKMTLPSGKAAWSSPVNLEKAFTWFFKTYKYDWPLVFKATSVYMDKQLRSNWKFCRTSQYFIRKDDTSDLADMCEIIKTGASIPSDQTRFKTKVV